jgi:exopolysaccharide biosynthesis protein
LLTACHATSTPQPLGLKQWSDKVAGPTAIHVLRVDMQDRRMKIETIVAPDPDGPGPAEATLTDPMELARDPNTIAAINANAFRGMIDSTGKRDSNWRAGQMVDIAGAAAHDGVVRSAGGDETAVNAMFGVDKDNRVYFGQYRPMQEAVNGWSFRLIEKGKVIPKEGGDRHPRTAIGADSTGRWLYLVVVDGRRPDWSIGANPRELADIMLRIGAYNAVNVDGGGSSILIMKDSTGSNRNVNRISGSRTRPVPVVLTVRRVQTEASSR